MMLWLLCYAPRKSYDLNVLCLISCRYHPLPPRVFIGRPWRPPSNSASLIYVNHCHHSVSAVSFSLSFFLSLFLYDSHSPANANLVQFSQFHLTLRSLFSLDGDFGFFSGDEFSDAIEKWRLHRRFLQRPPRRPSLASVWESGDLVTWSSLPFHHPSCLTQFLKSVARECGGWLPLVVTVPPLPSSHLSFSAPHPHWLHNQMHWKNPTTELPYKNASPILAAFHFHENWRRNTRQRRPNNPKHFNATYLDEGNANTATFSLIVHSTSSRQIFGFH